MLDFDTLVPAAQAGDKAAQDALMTALYGWSIGQTRKVIHDTEKAHNIALDFWSWLFKDKGINTYDAKRAKGDFHTWLAMRIRARALNAAEKPQPKLMYFGAVNDPNSFAPDPAVQVSALQDLEAVAADMKSGQHKEVFWRLIEGVAPQEIADELGISVKRARNLIGEVRAVIQRHLGESDGVR